jgi:4-amino-4-deoxy-L-arabinose transferase-like glycosyltransferase
MLRFWNLKSRGLIYWDEGKFALEGIRMQAVALHFLGRHSLLLAGKSVGTAKPTHALLFGLGYVVLGVHDWVPLFVDGLASVALVALTFLVARRLFSFDTALFAAGLLAVSEYEVIYARSALSESDGTLFLLVGVLVWLPRGHLRSLTASTRTAVAAGVIFGAGFTVNYRLLPYIGSLVLLDIYPLLKQRDFRHALPRIGVWIGGILALPVFWQIAGAVAQGHGIILFQNELSGARSSYLREAIYQLHQGKQSKLNFSPLTYLEWFAVREGPFVVLLSAVGFWVALRKRTPSWAIVCIPVALPFLVYTFAPFIVPRNLEAALPFVSIIAAAGLIEEIHTLGSVRRRTVLVVSVVLASIGIGSFMSWHLTAEQSGFAAAARYVELSHGRRLLSSTELMAFYFRGAGPHCDAPPIPDRVPMLQALVQSGYRYAVIERHGTTVSDFVRSHARLLRIFAVTGGLDLWENLINSENAHPPVFTSHQDRVWIYDLETLRFPSKLKTAGKIPACNRDIVT